MTDKSTSLLKHFGQRVKNKRNELDISQEQLGFDTGLDRTYISGIERGIRNPSLINISKIAKALKSSASELLPF